MADTTIEWATKVWNPVRGCSIVSKGCTNCYAMKQAHRFAGPGGKYEGLTRMSGGGPVWTGEVRTVPEMLDAPLRWRRPQRVFVNSMSDLFHEDVPDEFIDHVFGIMSACDRHIFQVLTKRPERMRRWFATRTPDISFGTPLKAGDPIGADPEEVTRWKIAGAAGEKRDNCGLDWPLRNVWLGVSVEDQATADERIPLLLETPAAIRWISYEPALGPIDFGGKWSKQVGRKAIGGPVPPNFYSFLNWIVVGGESGPGAREFDVHWASSVIAQCKAARTPVFLKQLGAKPWVDIEPDLYGAGWPAHVGINRTTGCLTLRDRKGGDPSEWPEDLRVREWPEVRT